MPYRHARGWDEHWPTIDQARAVVAYLRGSDDFPRGEIDWLAAGALGGNLVGDSDPYVQGVEMEGPPARARFAMEARRAIVSGERPANTRSSARICARPRDAIAGASGSGMCLAPGRSAATTAVTNAYCRPPGRIDSFRCRVEDGVISPVGETDWSCNGEPAMKGAARWLSLASGRRCSGGE
jgi:hypothetical protein